MVTKKTRDSEFLRKNDWTFLPRDKFIKYRWGGKSKDFRERTEAAIDTFCLTIPQYAVKARDLAKNKQLWDEPTEWPAQEQVLAQPRQGYGMAGPVYPQEQGQQQYCGYA